jgi:integrating conjugative element protein (TIGR03761 family)
LTLQTRQAQLLVRGRKGAADKSPIIGLMGFADRLRLIWQAARDDDPYADWWLIKVHEGIEVALSLVQQQQQSFNELLKQTAAFEISPAVSKKPFRMPLQFANPYAYQGAKLLSDYDRLVCTALTAQHVGLLDRESCRGELNPCSHKIRSLFCLPQGYRSLGVNRQMIRDDKEASERACQQMGQVPDDVLNGECRAPLVPRKLRFPNVFAKHVGLRTNASPANPPEQDSENIDG